ncbi:hypothetical protein CHCC20348_4134 [Bacillus paralicheniformis]|nr:hypothetical protein CHCC20348_4134 [Bacillus paralicheniformis]
MNRRPRLIRYQLQYGKLAGEHALPISLFFLKTFLCLRPLPESIIFVMQIRLRQFFPFIQCGQLIQYDRNRYAVRHKMMHIEQQHMSAVCETDETCSHQRSFCKIKAADKRFCHLFDRLPICFNLLNLELNPLMNVLSRLAIDNCKRSAQRLMPVNQFLKSSFKALNIKGALKHRRGRHIVADSGILQLADDINSLLRQ